MFSLTETETAGQNPPPYGAPRAQPTQETLEMISRILIALAAITVTAACQAPAGETTVKAEEAASKAEEAASKAEAAAARIEAAAAQIAAATAKTAAPTPTTVAVAPKAAPTPLPGAAEAGCPDFGEAVKATPVIDGSQHFGAPFALATSEKLSSALTKATEPSDKPIQVSGEVAKVCKKKGCWMVVKDGEMEARILMKGHSFAVPLDCDGKGAIVEGTLQTRTMSVGTMKHLAEDEGADPSKVTAPSREYVLTASGVEISG